MLTRDIWETKYEKQTTYLSFLLLNISGSANAQLRGFFCPLAFYWIIRLNMLPSDPFMSNLYSLLGHSTGMFQTFQLIVLVVFGDVD